MIGATTGGPPMMVDAAANTLSATADAIFHPSRGTSIPTVMPAIALHTPAEVMRKFGGMWFCTPVGM